jgi:hypothetical protein
MVIVLHVDISVTLLLFLIPRVPQTARRRCFFSTRLSSLPDKFNTRYMLLSYERLCKGAPQLMTPLMDGLSHMGDGMIDAWSESYGRWDGRCMVSDIWAMG